MTRIQSPVLFTLLCVLALLPAHVSAAPTDGSRIVEVTVYRDRAEVVRELTVELPAGPSTVQFADIPPAIDPDTLRIAAEGVPAVLGAVEIQERVEAPRETPEWRAARDEVQRLERESDTLKEDEAVDDELRLFLQSIRTSSSQGASRDLSEGRGDPAEIAGVYELMEAKLRALASAKLDRQAMRAGLAEQRALARARLQAERPATGIRTRAVAVEVEAARAGRLTLRLAYLTPGASWRPTYRATLDGDAGYVSLVAEGVVKQSTGEDWSAVELKLSSASPAVGVQPPMVTPRFLQPWVSSGDVEEMVVLRAGGSARFSQNQMALAPGVQDASAEEVDSDGGSGSVVAESEIVRSAYNVLFRVPGAVSVPGDGRDHRVVLRQERLAANVVHRTAPGLDDRAFLTAVTTSPQDYPLLAGPVRVFSGGAFLGSFPLEETGPGVELTLPFGVDNRVEVIRLPQPQVVSREGFSGKQRQLHSVERTIVHNLMDEPVTLVLEDRLPVSEDERIVVQIGRETTPGYRDSESRPGVKIWKMELAAGEKREIQLDYTVRHPRELVVAGLGS